MDSKFTNDLIYPEIITHKSLRLNTAPAEGERPPVGYVYQWETVINNEIFMNFRFNNGKNKSYALQQNNSNNKVEIANPDRISDFVWQPSDVKDGIVKIPNNYSIADLGFFTNPSQTTWEVVDIPITVDSNTYLHLKDVSPSAYPYGGIVRFAQGICVLVPENQIYNIASARGDLSIDAENGYTQYISAITGDLNISADNVSNMTDGKLLKVIVSNDSEYNVSVNGELIESKKFAVCFISISNTAYTAGNVIEIN